MQQIHIVLAHRDSERLDRLAAPQNNLFLNIATVNEPGTVVDTIAKSRAQLAVIDLELVGLPAFAGLCREFPGTVFITTHRLADDALWSASLAAGALDCRNDADLQAIIDSVEKYLAMKSLPTAPAA
jgi:hypothetical protein